jgi:hypothetical protein
VDFNVRPLDELPHDDIVQLAHARAERNEPMHPHGFPPGWRRIAFETAYQARRVELDQVEG